MSSPSGSYSESEAQEIIRRAAAVQSTGFMSRDELLRAAGELGITPEAVLEAEKQYQESRAEEDLKIRYLAKRQAEMLDSVKAFVVFGVIGAFVVHSNDHWLWIVAVVLAMSFFNVLKEASLYFMKSSPANQRRFQEFREKEGRRKSLADRRTNDKIIADILIQTAPNKKIHVIKNLRDLTGLPLNEAKTAVEDYYGRHPEIKQF